MENKKRIYQKFDMNNVNEYATKFLIKKENRFRDDTNMIMQNNIKTRIKAEMKIKTKIKSENKKQRILHFITFFVSYFLILSLFSFSFPLYSLFQTQI